MTNRKDFFAAVFIFVSLSMFSFVSCSSVPQAKSQNYLGNYPAQKLDTVMVNKLSGSNKLDPFEIKYTLYPKTNIVDMDMRYDLNAVTIPLSQANRQDMLAAMQKYLDDYQAGTLINDTTKEKGAYGRETINISWGIISTVYFAKPELVFQYHYVTDKKPYFIIKSSTLPPCDRNGDLLKNSGASSPELSIAFTPLQCKHLIEILNQDALVKIVSDLDAAQESFDIPPVEKTSEPNNLF